MDVKEFWNNQGKKIAIVLGVFFVLWRLWGRDEGKAAVAKPAPSVAPVASAVPVAPVVPVADARLYIPTSLPGVEGKTGFLGTDNSPQEAKYSGTSGSSRVTLLAVLGMGLDASLGTQIKIRESLGYGSSTEDWHSVTWKRGEVLLRVSVSDPAVERATAIDHAMKIAEAVDKRADEVIAMSAEERARELTVGKW